MLTIVFKCEVPLSPRLNTFGTEFNFHCGDNVNLGFWVNYYSNDIKLIQADGDELNHIIHNFNNVPCNVKKSVQIWRGDLARFIMENYD